MDKKPKIEFAPGCFDNFDGTQEELDELVKQITEMVESGELFDDAVPLDDLEEEEIDEMIDNQQNRTLQ